MTDSSGHEAPTQNENTSTHNRPTTLTPNLSPAGAVILPSRFRGTVIAPPARGKTTGLLAKLQAWGLRSVSLDALRLEIYGDENIQGNGYALDREARRREASSMDAGHSVVRDATGLNAKNWRDDVNDAHRHGFAAVALLATEIPLAELRERNANRNRQVPDVALVSFYTRHKQVTVERLYDAGFDLVVVWDDDTQFICLPDGVDGRGVVDIDGSALPRLVEADVHGMSTTERALFRTLGMDLDTLEFNGVTVVGLGDRNDKGMFTAQSLRDGIRMLHTGRMVWVLGNHEKKLLKALHDNTPTEDAGIWLSRSLADIRAQSDAEEFTALLISVLEHLPTHIVFDDLAVAHAALTTDTMFTDTGKARSTMLYKRDNWEWTGVQTLVHGHVDVAEVIVRRAPEHLWERDADGGVVQPGEVHCIDTGAFRQGGLTAYLTWTNTTVTVPTVEVDMLSDAERAAMHAAAMEILAKQERDRLAKAARRDQAANAVRSIAAASKPAAKVASLQHLM